MTPRLDAGRLALVPLVPHDASSLVDVLADATLYRYIGGEPPTLGDLERRYRAWVAGPSTAGETWHNWVIRLAGMNVAIGHLQATVFDDGRADIAWMIGTPWQRHGYATEAARALVAWLESAGATTINANIHPDNLPSARVAERAGLAPTEERVDGEVVWRRVG